MICRRCRDSGERSRVYEGASSSTLMAFSRHYWDEDGQLHTNPDPNTHSTSYRCSRGHRWRVDRRQGYPDEVTFMDGDHVAPVEFSFGANAVSQITLL